MRAVRFRVRFDLLSPRSAVRKRHDGVKQRHRGLPLLKDPWDVEKRAFGNRFKDSTQNFPSRHGALGIIVVAAYQRLYT